MQRAAGGGMAVIREVVNGLLRADGKRGEEALPQVMSDGSLTRKKIGAVAGL